ncbi:hypothetical protein [uncultured Desulfosarcina sp.]|uniref:hypothetical protein n=1 Tax=uncultured Desulfosarcina sp. TaxID=218289 RepID=UPI0029C9A16D|nr:hypothetical protein [uncultured Desulfosarcina sp.]
MKRLLFITLLFLIAGPQNSFADRSHFGTHDPVGVRSTANLPIQDLRGRLKRPFRPPVHPGDPGKPVHPIYPGYKPAHGRPVYWWPASITVVQEAPPIIIVNNPPPAAPAPLPEPEKVWVPPVMDTRTEPGYWDYGIRKVWMGDHWRYEQDHDERIWVPESQVNVVKQEGYWKTVD